MGAHRREEVCSFNVHPLLLLKISFRPVSNGLLVPNDLDKNKYSRVDLK